MDVKILKIGTVSPQVALVTAPNVQANPFGWTHLPRRRFSRQSDEFTESLKPYSTLPFPTYIDCSAPCVRHTYAMRRIHLTYHRSYSLSVGYPCFRWCKCLSLSSVIISNQLSRHSHYPFHCHGHLLSEHGTIEQHYHSESLTFAIAIFSYSFIVCK